MFDCLAAANLTVNLSKCEFAKDTVTYLGKVVGRSHVRPVRAKVTAIDRFPIPTTKKELMRFLGMVGFYRGFVRFFLLWQLLLPNFFEIKSNLSGPWCVREHLRMLNHSSLCLQC